MDGIHAVRLTQFVPDVKDSPLRKDEVTLPTFQAVHGLEQLYAVRGAGGPVIARMRRFGMH
jgi:hypothetical protein